VVVSMPFAILSYVLLWFMPQDSMSQAFSVPWFLVAACLFETLMSCFNVPYLSMNMFLGGDQRDRDSATAYRMTVEIVAMLLASVVQGQVIAVYNTERDGACQQLDPTQVTSLGTAAPHAASLHGTRKAFLTAALVVAGAFFLCSLVLFLGVREQKDPLSSEHQVTVPYLTCLKLMAGHAPFQRLVLGFLSCALAFQASASIAVPLWQAVLVRIGKNNTVLIGLSPFILAVTVVACVPGNLAVFMTMCVLMGLSLATMFLLPWSMLPDVVDDFTTKNPSCKDMEPMFFSSEVINRASPQGGGGGGGGGVKGGGGGGGGGEGRGRRRRRWRWRRRGGGGGGGGGGDGGVKGGGGGGGGGGGVQGGGVVKGGGGGVKGGGGGGGVKGGGGGGVVKGGGGGGGGVVKGGRRCAGRRRRRSQDLNNETWESRWKSRNPATARPSRRRARSPWCTTSGLSSMEVPSILPGIGAHLSSSRSATGR
ncbi:hypothetical protein CRUP_027603, partial [Coryphaenoides rupestris]